MNTDKIYAQSIVNEYSKKSASKVVALKKLDKSVKNPPQILAFTLGIVFSLVAGVGMCLAMGEIGGGGALRMTLGIIIGVIGFAGVCVNYPIYKRFLQSRKDKYAGDIINLANQISAQD